MPDQTKQQFWFAHISAWRDSGLSQQRYCDLHHLSVASLGYWIKRQRRVTQAGDSSPLVAVRVAPVAGPLVLRRGDWSLEMPTGVSNDWLAGLLRALS